MQQLQSDHAQSRTQLEQVCCDLGRTDVTLQWQESCDRRFLKNKCQDMVPLLYLEKSDLFTYVAPNTQDVLNVSKIVDAVRKIDAIWRKIYECFRAGLYKEIQHYYKKIDGNVTKTEAPTGWERKHYRLLEELDDLLENYITTLNDQNEDYPMSDTPDVKVMSFMSLSTSASQLILPVVNYVANNVHVMKFVVRHLHDKKLEVFFGNRKFETILSTDKLAQYKICVVDVVVTLDFNSTNELSSVKVMLFLDPTLSIPATEDSVPHTEDNFLWQQWLQTIV